ncbi:MAG: sulfur carrier protein ThiS adenylyltransferase ThiF [Kiritimatiellae bacterium]|nr:sulfur carrier protein ThiS adenylyltransferase ThiF [Kiritimatiellia bacterium]
MVTREAFYRALAAKHGEALQAKFAAARVAVCGLGGLGSNVATALARAGVGRLHVIDFDRVEITNLNRQQYAVSQIGQPKAEALRENLAAVNPFCEVLAEAVRITETNVAALFAEDDVICEAFDNAEAKAMLVNGVLAAYPGKPLVAASGMAGLGSPNTIRTRKVGNRFFLCGDGVSEAGRDIPLLSARVLACAAHEAATILRLIAGETEA